MPFYALFVEVCRPVNEPVLKAFLQLVVSAELLNSKKSLQVQNFNLFLHTKRFLSCKKFVSDDELKESVEPWLTSWAADFYKQDI